MPRDLLSDRMLCGKVWWGCLVGIFFDILCITASLPVLLLKCNRYSYLFGSMAIYSCTCPFSHTHFVSQYWYKIFFHWLHATVIKDVRRRIKSNSISYVIFLAFSALLLLPISTLSLYILMDSSFTTRFRVNPSTLIVLSVWREPQSPWEFYENPDSTTYFAPYQRTISKVIRCPIIFEVS